MKKKKANQTIISMSVQELFDIVEAVNEKYDHSCDDLYPARDYKYDTITLVSEDGNISGSVMIKFACNEHFDICIDKE